MMTLTKHVSTTSTGSVAGTASALGSQTIFNCNAYSPAPLHCEPPLYCSVAPAAGLLESACDGAQRRHVGTATQESTRRAKQRPSYPPIRPHTGVDVMAPSAWQLFPMRDTWNPGATWLLVVRLHASPCPPYPAPGTVAVLAHTLNT